MKVETNNETSTVTGRHSIAAAVDPQTGEAMYFLAFPKVESETLKYMPQLVRHCLFVLLEKDTEARIDYLLTKLYEEKYNETPSSQSNLGEFADRFFETVVQALSDWDSACMHSLLSNSSITSDKDILNLESLLDSLKDFDLKDLEESDDRRE